MQGRRSRLRGGTLEDLWVLLQASMNRIMCTSLLSLAEAGALLQGGEEACFQRVCPVICRKQFVTLNNSANLIIVHALL